MRWQCLKIRIVIHNESLSVDLAFSKFLLNFLKPPQQCSIVILIYILLEWFSRAAIYPSHRFKQPGAIRRR